MKRFLQKAMTLLIMCILTGIVFAFVFDQLQRTHPRAETIPAAPRVTQTVEKETVTQLVHKIRDGVVAVLLEKDLPYYGKQIISSGSGVLYDEDEGNLYFITNHHVVSGEGIYYIEPRQGERVEAHLLASDSDTDIAVLSVKKNEVRDLPQFSKATMGSTDELEPGDMVLAVGNSLGYGQSITKGIVSAIDRDLQSRSSFAYKLIQTDAAINPGNSGGALVNDQGEVIGINTLKISDQDVEGVGFAIPVEASLHIADTLRQKGFLPKTMLGVATSTPDMLRMDPNLPKGVIVREVIQHSPAEKSGIKVYDLITRVDQKEITQSEQLGYEIRSRKPGESIRITLYREGKTHEITVTLGESTE